MTTTTKTATHTPGPWVATGYRDTVVNAPNGNTLCLHPGDADHCPIETVQANARLIAAAPELLAACRSAREHCGRMPDDAWTESLVTLLDAAVAKATGGE